MALLEERRRLGNLRMAYGRHGDFFEHSEMTSIYYTHDMKDFFSRPVNFGSFLFRKINSGALSPYGYTTAGRSVAAGMELLERSTNRYRKPSFGIESVTCADDHVYAIHERVLEKKPFCQLLHSPNSWRALLLLTIDTSSSSPCQVFFLAINIFSLT